MRTEECTLLNYITCSCFTWNETKEK